MNHLAHPLRSGSAMHRGAVLPAPLRALLLGTVLAALASACSPQAADKPADTAAPASDGAAVVADAGTKQAALDKALVSAPAKASVADAAEVLSPEAEARIAAKLKEVEAKSGHPMAVVTVKSLEGTEAADYAMALARKWELGRPGYADGLLLLVAPGDKQLTIDRGSGLHKALTKEAAQKIIDEKMIPAFKTGDFGSGVEAGAMAVADLLAAVPNDTRAEAEAARLEADKKAAAAIEAATKGQ